MKHFAMAGLALAGCALAAILPALAAGKPKQEVWNLTGETINVLQFAPAGTDKFGPNQTLNDDNHAVEHDERLPLKDVKAGTYDVRFTDETGRTCLIRNIEVKAQGRVDLMQPTESDCKKP